MRYSNPPRAFDVTRSDGRELTIYVSGRNRWMLEQMLRDGPRGTTSAECAPGLRLSGYVHSLRNMGVEIETLMEEHHGTFPGYHGRYFLRCKVVPLKGGAA
ncbi:hypothetical protein [Thioclava sp. GXIMD4215]|uniref:winged helix domain-containing protein n=1 Tax=Thioclava sp. GXIMD4215 TaxID=3131928 RepID=UPI00324EBB7A